MRHRRDCLRQVVSLAKRGRDDDTRDKRPERQIQAATHPLPPLLGGKRERDQSRRVGGGGERCLVTYLVTPWTSESCEEAESRVNTSRALAAAGLQA